MILAQLAIWAQLPIAGRLAPAARVPLEPGRDQARQWARQELARREYQAAQPTLLERLLDWLGRKVSRLQFDGGPPPRLGLGIVVLLLALVIGYVLYRTGGLRPNARRRPEPVLLDDTRTAESHREAADRHAGAGEWNLAVVERFRAIARELEERVLLRPAPGRTAFELARDGAAALPDLAADLRLAARHFDDVSYGQLAAGAAADAQLRRLDERIRAGQRASR